MLELPFLSMPGTVVDQFWDCCW